MYSVVVHFPSIFEAMNSNPSIEWSEIDNKQSEPKEINILENWKYQIYSKRTKRLMNKKMGQLGC
jgi:hypothetical protein